MTDAKLRRQFEIENAWRNRILEAPDSKARYALYGKAYSEITEFFASAFPDKREFGYKPGSLLPRIASIAKGRDAADYGCGYGYASMDLAECGAKSVAGFEVSDEMREWAKAEAARRGLRNVDFRPVIDGRMGLPPSSVDLFFCHDVCEHLHPDDYAAHLREAYRSLRPGGYYYCETVLKRFGPNDISREFVGVGNEAQGLHLREYDFEGIREQFEGAGFTRLLTPWISPRFVRRSPWRSLSLTIKLEGAFLGRSGFATGALGMDGIYLLARK